MSKFDGRYIEMAEIWARNSYCKRRQVGALLVKDNMIILYILCVTAAYSMIILSIGNVSIKLRRQEA